MAQISSQWLYLTCTLFAMHDFSVKFWAFQASGRINIVKIAKTWSWYGVNNLKLSSVLLLGKHGSSVNICVILGIQRQTNCRNIQNMALIWNPLYRHFRQNIIFKVCSYLASNMGIWVPKELSFISRLNICNKNTNELYFSHFFAILYLFQLFAICLKWK